MPRLRCYWRASLRDETRGYSDDLPGIVNCVNLNVALAIRMRDTGNPAIAMNGGYFRKRERHGWRHQETISGTRMRSSTRLHVRTFCDSNGDGIGDFAGFDTEAGLPSRIRSNSDLASAFLSLPDCATMATTSRTTPRCILVMDLWKRFQAFLNAAHARGIRVIIELVVNHTSDQHPWFKEARSSRNNPKRDWYVWSDTDTITTKECSIIFVDTETSNWAWDPVSKSYYWHRFFSHQPDLNFDNPAVFETVWEVMKFWLELGVDGFRLDAVAYFGRTGRDAMRKSAGDPRDYPGNSQAAGCGVSGTMLLAEANQWPADVRAYFGDSNEFHAGVSLPAHAAHVHGGEVGGSQTDHRDPGTNARNPRDLPVVYFSPQSRRTDAGNGDGG